MDNSGMVAVVRGLRDSRLAVTLLDSGKQYTLVPNSALTTPDQSYTEPPQRSTGMDLSPDRSPNMLSRDSSAQATDGRYASVYQTTHCKVKPTSPPVLLTEFPPQRADVYPGHDNFIVGGTGSGDTNFCPFREQGSFRGGGLQWPDRGSVCSPRPSREPNAFAQSLRRYPALSPDRSSEIVERLITYTQAKNSAKNNSRFTRTADESLEYSEQTFQNASRSIQRPCDPDTRLRVDDSPTRDKSRRSEEDQRTQHFNRSYDVKCLRDMSRRVRDTLRSQEQRGMVYLPYHQPVVPNREKFVNTVPEFNRTSSKEHVSSKVNTECQAAAKMICREVATTPRILPVTRNVAVPLSPASSKPRQTSQDSASINTVSSLLSFKSVPPTLPLTFRSVKTATLLPVTMRSAQTSLSLIELSNSNYHCQNARKSRSELNVMRDVGGEVCDCLEDVDNNSVAEGGDVLKELRKELNKNYKDNGHKESTNTDSPKVVTQSSTKQDRNEVFNKVRFKNRYTTLFRAQVNNPKVTDGFEAIISNWLDGLPMKTHDLLGRCVQKDKIVASFVNQLKNESTAITLNKNKLKSEIIDLLDELPIDTNRDKNAYFNRIANELIYHLDKNNNSNDVKTYNYETFNYNDNVQNKYNIQTTAREIRNFVLDELSYFIDKHYWELNVEKLKDTENGLTEILVDSIEAIRSHNDKNVIDKIASLLRDSSSLSQNQAAYLSNLLICRLKDILNATGKQQISFRSTYQTYMFPALQNAIQTSDFSIEGLSDGDIQANLDLYIHQLSKQIDEWLTNLPVPIPKSYDDSFRQVVVNDLAGDIVDRHRYLELNPDSRGSEQDELENLKYQIFKWINKLVGEDQMETIKHASELMRRIRSIPVPMLAKSDGHKTRQGMGPKTKEAGSANRRFSSPTASRSLNLSQTSMSRPTGGSQSKRNPAYVSTGPMFTEPIVTQYETLSGSMQNKRALSPNRTNSPCCNSLSQGGPLSPCCEPFSQPCCKHTSQNVSDLKHMSMFEQPRIDPSMGPGRFSAPGGYPRDLMFAPPEASQMAMPGPSESVAYAAESKSGPDNQPVPEDSIRNVSTTFESNAQPFSQVVEQVHEEFDNFIKHWIQEIPIKSTTPEERDLAELMRLGLYNGIWKAITKLKCRPQILANSFYYEDALDDEIQALFSLLPHDPEMEAKQHNLKVKLIKKTSEINKKIKMAYAPEIFKEKVIDKIGVYVPRLKTSEEDEDSIKLHEDLKILCLAEEFILYTRYRSDDQIKANVYRKKLMDRAHEFVVDLKRNHGKELKDINVEVYANDIVSALHQVPLPTENTIKEEADEILLGLEIEQWFKDLPLAQINDVEEYLKRRRLRDALARKLHEMQKSMDLTKSSSDRPLRHEISLFLEKIPLARDESLNINFMVDELANRIRNRERQRDTEENGKKAVAFQDTVQYDDFSQNVLVSSSFAATQSPRQAYQSNLPTIVSSGNVSTEGPCCTSMSQGGPLDPCCAPFSQPCCQQQPVNVPIAQQQQSQWHSLQSSLPPQTGQPQPYQVPQLQQSIQPFPQPAQFCSYSRLEDPRNLGASSSNQWQVVNQQPAGPAIQSSSYPLPNMSDVQAVSLMTNDTYETSVGGHTVGGTYVTPPNLSQLTGYDSMFYPGRYPQTAVLQDPRSYGTFDQDRPFSSSFNQSQAQGPQWYATPARSEVEMISRQNASGPAQIVPRQSVGSHEWLSFPTENSTPGQGIARSMQQSIPRQSLATSAAQNIPGHSFAVPMRQGLSGLPNQTVPRQGQAFSSRPRLSLPTAMGLNGPSQTSQASPVYQNMPNQSIPSTSGQRSGPSWSRIPRQKSVSLTRSRPQTPDRSRQHSPPRNREKSTQAIRSDGSRPHSPIQSPIQKLDAASQVTPCQPCHGRILNQHHPGEAQQAQFNRSDRLTDQNRSSRPTFDQPIGYSTPEQPRVSQDNPPAPGRKPQRQQRPVTEPVRRRLDIEFSEDETDGESRRVRCRCVERLRRCRKRRPVCISLDDCDLDYGQCPSMRYFYPCY